MYKIQDAVYAKLFKEVIPEKVIPESVDANGDVVPEHTIPEHNKFIWKFSTEKPTDNFLIIKTMRKADETKILEFETSLQADIGSSKKDIMKVGLEKSKQLIDMIIEKTDFSFSKYKAENLDTEKLSTLFYEWWSFSRASEEDYNLFL